ncbi:ESPR domain-containing protein [Gallibacterium trehalosifermentans]|uniref:ESPR domain-containing protein n=1 Tax=Gallibacterium trehalosifermentans TaxID=516935 RepID=A0ABV6H2I2_9PAST
MNKIYRVIWNTTLGVWQCVSELTLAKGKTKTIKENNLNHQWEGGS